MKCQILFSRNNKENITISSSDESAHSLVSVNSATKHVNTEHLACYIKISADTILKHFSKLSEKIIFDISCKCLLAYLKTTCIDSQIVPRAYVAYYQYAIINFLILYLILKPICLKKLE